MLQFIGSVIINYFSWVLLGTLVALLVYFLDRKKEDLIPTFIAAIVGAVAGGLMANLIFGSQLSIVNLSSLFLVLTGAFLLSILAKLLRFQSEQEVQTQPSLNLRQSSYEYAYFSDVRPEKHKKDLEKILDQAQFPLSNRDLVRLAEKSAADRTDLTLLESLPDHIYQNKTEILKLIS